MEATVRQSQQEQGKRSAPPADSRTHIQSAGLLVGILLCLVLLALFNLFPDALGILVFFPTGDASTQMAWTIIPILTSAFFVTYLPFLNVLWVLSIVLKLFLLYKRRWQVGTHLVAFCFTLFWAAVLWWMLVGPSIVDLEQIGQGFSDVGLNTSALVIRGVQVIPLLPALLETALILALVVTCLNAAYRLYLVLRAVSAAGRSAANK